MKNIQKGLILAVCSIVLSSLHSSEVNKPTSQKPKQLWNLTSADDNERLRSKIEQQLTLLAKAQIKMLEDKQKKPFTPTDKFITQQQTARDQFVNDALPLITKTITLPQIPKNTGGKKENKKSGKKVKVIDIDAINALKAAQLMQVLESVFHLMGLFPPLPTQAKSWSKALTPFLTFDAEARKKLANLINSWLDALLENGDDIETLATVAKLPKEKQMNDLQKMRKHYSDLMDNVSQLFYAWVQASNVLNKENPLKAFLRHATTKPNALGEKFDSLREKVREALSEKQNTSPSDADVDGFIMLMITSLFAPEDVWEELSKMNAE